MPVRTLVTRGRRWACAIPVTILLGCTPLRQYRAATATDMQGSSPDTSVDATLQRLTDDAINEHGLVGLQVAIVLANGHAWTGASGTVDLARRTPLTTHSVIRLGSLTKTYTALAALRLVERGHLRLEDAVDRWVPECEWSTKITVRMLLSHASGIPELLGPRVMMLSTMQPSRRWGTSELLHMICSKRLAFRPGSDHRYSNSNYVLLGIILERLTGHPLTDVYRDEITRPLRLRQTYYLPTDTVPPFLVAGNDRDLIPLPGWHRTNPQNTAWSTCAAASGGMSASAADVARFFAAVMEGELLGEATRREMWTFVSGVKPADRYLVRFGLGLFAYGDVFRGTYGHLGLFVGSQAVALFDPQRRFVLVLLANVSRVRDLDGLVNTYLRALAP